jgi:NADH-quinone oxidoreductase subunit E
VTGPDPAPLSPQVLEEIRALPSRYPEQRSAVMPALDLAQEELGYLTPDAMTAVARELDLDPGYVEGVATFYSLFHLEPVGKHRIYLCTNIACMLRGAEELAAQLRQKLALEASGDVTKDGLFSVEEVECLGCCEYAPVARIDHRFHYDLTLEKLEAIVAERRSPSSPSSRPTPPAKVPRKPGSKKEPTSFA